MARSGKRPRPRGGFQVRLRLSTSYFSTAGFHGDKGWEKPNILMTTFRVCFQLGAPLASNFREEVLVNYNQSRINIDDGAGSASGDPIMDDPNNWTDQKQVLVGSKPAGSWGLGTIFNHIFHDNYLITPTSNPLVLFTPTLIQTPMTAKAGN